jgi:hypothetical protein
MPRGKPSKIGDETVNALGYTQVKTKRGWVGKHIIIAEKKLNRPLNDNERVIFKDNDRSNLDPSNIKVVLKLSARRSPQARLAAIEAEILELTAQAEILRREIDAQR